jgi:hypothetical protein
MAPGDGVDGNTQHHDQEHRQDAEQPVARKQQLAMQPHADGVSHDPPPPPTPFFAKRIALLRIDDRAVDLPDLVAVGDERPGQVEILDIRAVGDSDVTQDFCPEHPA